MRYESFAYEVILSDQLFWTKLVLILKKKYSKFICFIVDQEGYNLNLCSALFDRWILKAGQVLNRVHKISFVILRFTIGALYRINDSVLLVPAAQTPETASAGCFFSIFSSHSNRARASFLSYKIFLCASFFHY